MNKTIRKIIRGVKKETPLILSCISAIGTIATGVLASFGTEKAIKAIEASGAETKAEKAKVGWKYYIPAVISGAASIACTFGSQGMNTKRQADLAGAYIFADQTLKRYKKVMKENYGVDIDKVVKEQFAQDAYNAAPIEKEREDTLLFWEPHYDGYFERTMEEVRDAEYQFNRKLVKTGEASVNDFLHFLGLDEKEIGDALGWSIDFFDDTDFGDEESGRWVDFEHRLLTLDDGLECYMILTSTEPTADYDLPFRL